MNLIDDFRKRVQNIKTYMTYMVQKTKLWL